MSDRSPFSDAPIVVHVGEQPVEIPHRNAAEWINAVHAANGPGALVVFLARENTSEIVKDELAAGLITLEEIQEASLDLIREAVPYQWWKTVRLMFLSGRPEVLGRTVMHGMDPWELGISQWCAGVYALCTENSDDRGRLKFDASLESRPAGVEDDDVRGDESFDALVNQARNMPGMG